VTQHLEDFAALLQAYMARALRTNRDLAQLTGIALRTIENWTSGEVRRPRSAPDVLKLARALALDPADTNALLQAAGHPPLETMREQTADPRLQALLATWAAAPPAPSPAEPAQAAHRQLRHQLRPPVADFVGRESEAARLTAALQTALERGSGAVISGLYGMGGIGKTELAYLLAHRLRAAVPDAQIVLNLRGSSAAPLSPVQALQSVLRAFTPEAPLETDLELLQARYRSALHGQRALIVADDASGAAQVRPLLPPQGCALLVTSRQRFTLPGMIAVDLEVLAEGEAAALLRSVCERLEETEARVLARVCGYLPLALRISASILQTTPALPAAGYIRQLADERQRLTRLRDPDDPELDLAASLTFTYAQLDAAAQTVFRQLGVFAAAFPTALALAVVPAPGGAEVAPELHRLLRLNLVMYDTERERWRLHDLVRDLARHYLETHGEMDAAYVRYARAAVALAQDIQEQYLAGDTVATLAQFDTERPHIDAAYRWAQARAGTAEGDQVLIDIALATRYIALVRSDPQHEFIPLLEEARKAARRLGSLAEEGRALNSLGVAYSRIGDAHRAIGCHEQRLAIARAIGDRQGESQSLGNLGAAYIILGEPAKAVGPIQQRIAIARELGDRRSEGVAHLNLGLALYNLGELPRAISSYEQHLAIARAVDDRHSEATALGNLGLAYRDMGKPQTAVSYYEQALAACGAIGDRPGEIRTLGNLGNAYTDLGDARRAAAICESALAMAQTIGVPREEAYALSYLARAQAAQGDLARAAATFDRAIALFQQTSERWGAAECRWLFGLALAQSGERERCLPLLRAALAYQRQIGYAKAAEHAALLANLEAGAPGAAIALGQDDRRVLEVLPPKPPPVA
jgi:tetratricopeptide (TPR) repeat protein